MDENFPTIRKRSFSVTPEWKRLISGPFIWAPLIPMLFLDLFVEIYHHTCFPLYGLKVINRSKYFFFDRSELELTWYEKINCHYCSYANGLAAYFVAIAGETEAYWCAIKHKQKISLETQPHTKNFIDRSRYQ